MDVCVRLFCVCVALRQADPPYKESYRLSYDEETEVKQSVSRMAYAPKWEQQERGRERDIYRGLRMQNGRLPHFFSQKYGTHFGFPP
jgi:hypothetical protein